ncbi:MAG: anthrone oxygenase family protein [Anaerolineae bacterium]
MKKITAFIAIIGIAAFAGNMINIGLSYGLHWSTLEPVAFMTTFAVDFPLLLYPTVATLLPAFIATIAMFFLSDKGSRARQFWLYALIGLLIINVQTIAYHLPLNLAFMDQRVEPNVVGNRLTSWLIAHWIRVVVAIVAGVFAIRGFESSLEKE